MKILFVCRKFDRVAGGVERMSIVLMNEMVARGHDVALLTWDRRDAVPHYQLSAEVAWKKLKLGDPERRAGWGLRLKRQCAIRRFARDFRPDVIIGFQSGTFLAARVAVLGKRIPVIAAERNSPQRFDFLSGGKFRHATFAALLLARCVTVQFASYIPIYPRYLRKRIRAIPNPVWPVAAAQAAGRTDGARDGARMVLNVGRLSCQKNQKFLIDAFAKIAGAFPDWRLVLVGDGELADVLEARVRDLHLAGRVVFTGGQNNVAAWYAGADLFALPSHFEGFPNALAEAMSHGLPAIGLKATVGVNELIVHGRNGLLTDSSIDAFAAGLRNLMSDTDLRAAFGAKARCLVQRYQPTTVFDQWEDLFLTMRGKKSR